MAVQIQLRRGTASQWTSANPILAEGEMGVELDTGKWKFGNGTGTWSVLAYGSGAALLDADKGDITVSNTGTTWLIDAGAVTYAKMQAASTSSRVLGASSTSTTIQELTLGTGLSLSGTTLTATGGVTDGDKGDITVSSSGASWVIDSGAVTYAKLQTASTNSKLLGTSSTSTTFAELTLGTGLSLSGTTLTATGGVTDGDKGDITVSATGSSWVIDSGAVTYAKIQPTSTSTVLLGASSTSTTVAELTVGSGLSLSGTTLTATAVGLTDGDKGDITVASTGTSWTIDNSAVTNAKMANMTASTIKARITASTGAPEDATLTQVLDLVGSAAQGDILYRGASMWSRLAAGTSGHYLKTNGTGSDPAWAAVSAGGSTNVWIPASAWIPRTTTGAGIDSRELSTNKINIDELLFDAGTDEFAQAMIVMPSNWNAGTVTAKFHWTASTGSGDVVWGLQGRAYANDDALDQAMGTAQTATDTLTATNDVDISPATSAITLGGTAASGNPVIFQVYRDADAGGDTLGADARLLGVEISYTAS